MVARLALLCLLLAGCATTTGGDFCQVEHPIRPTRATINAMSDSEIRDALAHNLKGVKLCGWKTNG
jgi:hypothetical protein